MSPKKKLIKKVVTKSKKIQPQIKGAFSGKHSMYAILCFLVGGVFLTNALWRIVHDTLGLVPSLVIGFILFVLGGVFAKEFRK